MNDLLSLSDVYQLSLHAVNLVCPWYELSITRIRKFIVIIREKFSLIYIY